MRTLIPQLDPNKLRSARRSAGLSAQDVADALGVTVKQVFNYENGFSSMPGDRLVLFKRLCDLSSVEQLYTDAHPGQFSTRKKSNKVVIEA